MDRLTPPRTTARLRFTRASGVCMIVLLQLVLIYTVAAFQDERYVDQGAELWSRVGEFLARSGLLWVIVLVKLSTGAWQALRLPWPLCASAVPRNLSAGVCAPGILGIWLLSYLDETGLIGGGDRFFTLLAWVAGLTIACSLLTYHFTARWLLGPKIRSSSRPYAAGSAHRSSDGKPLWGYRMIFVTLGWGFGLFSVGSLFQSLSAAVLLAALSLACFCQWRDLQGAKFTPAVWYRGLVIMVTILILAPVFFGVEFASVVILFFGFCVINWGAATARDLFFRSAGHHVQDASAG